MTAVACEIGVPPGVGSSGSLWETDAVWGREHPTPGANFPWHRRLPAASGVMEVTGWAVPAGLSHGGGGKGRARRPLALLTARVDSGPACVLQAGSDFAFTQLSWSGFALCFGPGPTPYEVGSLFREEKRRGDIVFSGRLESPLHHLPEVGGSSASEPALLRRFWEEQARDERTHLTILLGH